MPPLEMSLRYGRMVVEHQSWEETRSRRRWEGASARGLDTP